MREIKYRCWDKDRKRIISWEELTETEQDCLPEMFYVLTNFYKDLSIPMQFTGLHDKNGKEIYEGDLVKIPDDYEEYGFFAGEIREIYFLDGCFRFKPKQQHVIDRGDRGATIQDDMECCEVIGNIYETKETQN
jgi:uncharacterized phage protein (TIGR01671 family)